jgi:hypothetical protein
MTDQEGLSVDKNRHETESLSSEFAKVHNRHSGAGRVGGGPKVQRRGGRK